jgi:MEMO1 family protein
MREPAVRRAAVAGTWYPSDSKRLTAQVNALVSGADIDSKHAPTSDAALIALIAPHAGLVYSGPVAAHAYRLLRDRQYNTVVMIGPSHYVGFTGASIWPRGHFETPLGPATIDEGVASAILEQCPLIHERPDAHEREHSLEMQLPFLRTLAPGVPIVPIVMGQQTRETAFTVGDCLATVLKGRRALVIASSDLSHFFDARTAAFLDAQVVEDVEAIGDESLMTRLERRPDHACGGGPMVSVIRAARLLGVRSSRVLKYADSGDVSGDKVSVVGYLAAALWH